MSRGAPVTAAGPRDRGHSGQGADAGAAGEAEQDGFGLVVAGVAEQDRGGAVALGRGVEGGVAGVAGRGLWPGAAPDPYGDGFDGIEPQGGEPRGDLGGAEIGAVLETVVDSDAAGSDGELGGLEGEGGGEGHGVGAAGACHEHERRGRALVRGRRGGLGGVGGLALGRGVLFVEDVVEDAADRQAYRRDRRMGTHVRFPS